MTAEAQATVAALLAAVRAREPHRRQLVAVVGPPAAGKSTVAAAVVNALNAEAQGRAALVGQDGFHFDDTVLEARGDRARKGAPHTFDVGGLRALLLRLQARDEATVAVPVFDRGLEIARAGAAIVPREATVIVVEGNYLLLQDAPWSDLRPLFDLTVRLDVSPETLRDRLMQRWRDFDVDPAKAAAWVESNDLPNARLVLERSGPADLVLPN